MPALVPTDHYCEIVYLGAVADREVSITSAPLQEVFAGFGGVEGECHGGATRASCSRVLSQYPRGTEIRNVRQFSIVSEEELALAATEVGLDAIVPEWLGTSIMVRGIADFTFLPPSSRLQAESGATLVVDMENRPCIYPGKEAVEPMHPGKGKLIKPALNDRRGVTAWVEREGTLRLGEKLRLHVPDQRGWQGG